MSLRFDSKAYDMLFPRQKPVEKVEKSCEKFEEPSTAASSETDIPGDMSEDIETDAEGGEVDGLGTGCESCS